VDDVKLVEILNTGNDLVEKLECLWLFNSLVFHDVVEKLTSIGILHDKVELFWCLDDFIELNDVWMSDELENVYFSRDSFDIVDVLDFVFFENLDSYSLVCQLVYAQLDFTEGTLANSFICYQ